MLKLFILLVSVLGVLADEPFSIGLGTLSPSYQQTVGLDKDVKKVNFEHKSDGFAYTIGDPASGSTSYYKLGSAANVAAAVVPAAAKELQSPAFLQAVPQHVETAKQDYQPAPVAYQHQAPIAYQHQTPVAYQHQAPVAHHHQAPVAYEHHQPAAAPLYHQQPAFAAAPVVGYQHHQPAAAPLMPAGFSYHGFNGQGFMAQPAFTNQLLQHAVKQGGFAQYAFPYAASAGLAAAGVPQQAAFAVPAYAAAIPQQAAFAGPAYSAPAFTGASVPESYSYSSVFPNAQVVQHVHAAAPVADVKP